MNTSRVGCRTGQFFTWAVSLILSCILLPPSGIAQDTARTQQTLRLIADRIVHCATYQFVEPATGKHFRSPTEAPDSAHLGIDCAYSDWRYWNGVLNLAMLRAADALAEPAYATTVARNIAFCFDNYAYFEKRHAKEEKWNYPFGQFFMMEVLDDCGAMGGATIEVYRHDPQKRYRDYIDKTATFMVKDVPRYTDGTLVREFPLRWTLWADDLYMSESFLSRMGELTGDRKYFDDGARQVINFHKHLFDESKGLMYHNWYSDKNRHGVAFWGRANGWAMVAQVDLLDRLPKDHPLRAELISLLQRHIMGIIRWQGPDGLWHQLLDKSDSYPETSCSAMFTYAIARAVHKGYIEPRYLSAAQRGWEGILTKVQPDGQIAGICEGTGVGDDLVFYYHRPTPLNDPHGIGAVLLAGVEMLAGKGKE